MVEVDDELEVVDVEDELVEVDEVELEVVVKLKFDFCRFPNKNSAICLRKFSYYNF